MGHELLEMKLRSDERSRIIKAMAHPTRVLVLDVLSGMEKRVGELAAIAGCDITTISKHLSIMRKAGLVDFSKKGVESYYRIACPCFFEFFRCIDLISLNQKTSASGGIC